MKKVDIRKYVAITHPLNGLGFTSKSVKIGWLFKKLAMFSLIDCDKSEVVKCYTYTKINTFKIKIL